MAASDALSPDQKRRAYQRFQAQLYAAPLDYHTNTVEDAGRFVRDNPEPGSYTDYGDGGFEGSYGGED